MLTGLLFVTASCSSRNDQAEAPTEEEIISLARSEGDRISSVAQQALGGQLKAAMASGGPVHAVEFCNASAALILDTLQPGWEIRLKRASLRVRNPKDTPDAIEKEILNMYAEQVANGREPEPMIEEDGKQLIYAKPILLNNPICLSCHGVPGKDIMPETLEKLQELYPEDRATGHKMGDLRGIWSITFNTKELEDYLNQRK